MKAVGAETPAWPIIQIPIFHGDSYDGVICMKSNAPRPRPADSKRIPPRGTGRGAFKANFAGSRRPAAKLVIALTSPGMGTPHTILMINLFCETYKLRLGNLSNRERSAAPGIEARRGRAKRHRPGGVFEAVRSDVDGVGDGVKCLIERLDHFQGFVNIVVDDLAVAHDDDAVTDALCEQFHRVIPHL